MRKIPSARFNLKSPNAKSSTLIFLVFRYNGKKLLYSTGLNIKPTDWDQKSQRPILRERRKDLWLLNQKIESLSQDCKQIYIETNYGDISIADFKSKLSYGEQEKTKAKKSSTSPKQ